MLAIDVLTIFPEIFKGFLGSSLVKKATDRGLFSADLIDIRTFADPPHFNVDDSPYGGGAGMVMKPEPLARAIEHSKSRRPGAPVILLTPSGEIFRQSTAHELSMLSDLILICGRYEGIDQRIIDLYVDREISIGDYVLMGGEIASMVVIEATLRLVENVLGNAESAKSESFSLEEEGKRLLEAPHYTRPAEFRGLKVPDVLLSGNHKRVAEWRRDEALRRTGERRPDLLDGKIKGT